MPSLRLLSLNTATATGGHDDIARTIEDAGVDLACLHGAPSLLRWRSISAAIARKAGLVVIGGGRTAGGNLLMSTLGVDVVGVRDLAFGHGVRPPGAALAVLRLRGSEFTLAGARLPVPEPDRLRQIVELRAAVDSLVPADPPALYCVEAVRADTVAWGALSERLVAVAGGVFVDGRIGITDAVEIAGGVRVELALPEPAQPAAS